MMQRASIQRTSSVTVRSRPGFSLDRPGGRSRAAMPSASAAPLSPMSGPMSPLALDRPGGRGRADMPFTPVSLAQVPAPIAFSRPGGGASRMGLGTPAAASSGDRLNSGEGSQAPSVDRPSGGSSRLAPFSQAPEQPVTVPLAVPERPGGGGGRGGPIGGDGNGGGSGGGRGDDGNNSNQPGDDSSGSGGFMFALFVAWVGACFAAYYAHNKFIAPAKAGQPKVRPCCQGKAK